MSRIRIKVCCRFRPRNEVELREEAGRNQQVVNLEDDTVNLHTDGDHKFNYDHVFPEHSTQTQVFDYAIAPMVEDVLNGFNCTIFAYGQTGSGKTHTLMGYGKNPGIIPRMVERLFDKMYDSDEDIQFILNISFVEIYLEKIRDLLNPEEDNLRIREGGYKNGIWIQGVTEQYVSSCEDILEIIEAGNANRMTAATRMNNRSSRSHSVFMLNLEQTIMSTGVRKSSKLVIVDLAGSEKVGKTGASGLTLLQAQHTNKSLTALGLVIKSLSEHSSHIPYRDSKLTRILTDSLGGNSKTCLIITCSPSIYNASETLSTLRFGACVKTIKNKAHANIEMGVNEYKKLLHIAEERIRVLEERQGTGDVVPAEDLSAKEEAIKEKEEAIKALEALLIKKKNEIDDLADDFRQQLAQKEEELVVLETDLTKKLSVKEEELKVKQQENDKLKRDLEAKTTEMLKGDAKSENSNSYLKRILNSRSEMIEVLETALTKAEHSSRAQKEDYEQTIRKLRGQIDDLHNVLYKPTISRAVRNFVRPIKRRARKK
jgi:kinesin family protein 5